MSGNSRKTGTEQYYTPLPAARALTEFLIEEVGVQTEAEWIEPAGGTGAFLVSAGELGVKHISALDLEPKHPQVVQGDFLSDSVSCTAQVCITNPPFGRNHSLSVPFFNKLAHSCDVIAFVIPRSWRKWSVVNRLDSNFVKLCDWNLDLTYEDAEGSALTTSKMLNTAFQVWARFEEPRVRQPHPRPSQQFTTCKPSEADASITVFGRGCGKVRTDFPRVPNTTQMFIKADPDIVEALASLDLSAFYNEVAYVEALSRVEIDYALEQFQAGKSVPQNFLQTSGLVQHPLFPVPTNLRTGTFSFTQDPE